MSLVQKPFAKKPQYLLNISDIEVSRTSRALNMKSYFGMGKKGIAGVFIALLLFLTTASGFLAYASSTPQASAEFWADGFCTKFADESNVTGQLGVSITTALTAQGTQTDGLLTVKGYSGEKTAYERFSPFLPNFDSWYGNYIDPSHTGDITYKYDGDKTVQLKNKESNSVLSHSVIDCTAGKAGKALGTAMVNGFFYIPKLMVFLGAEVYGWALDNNYITDAPDAAGKGGSVLYPVLFGDPTTNTSGLDTLITGGNGVKGLKDLLYLPFLAPIIMISALSLLYMAIKQRATTAVFSSAAWMILATIAGILFISHPMWIPQGSDYVVKTVQQSTVGALQSDPTIASICDLSSTSTTATTRELKCAMWYNTIYLPWESGQYGTTDTSANSVLRKDNMDGYLKTRSITIGAHTITGDKMTWAIWQLRDQKLPDGSTSRISQIAYSQLGSGMNLVWGGDILRQFNAALLSLIASIGTLIMVISSSFMLLGYQIVLIFLVVLSPFFFLVGAAPGFGRRILMRWFELVTSLVIKRILLTFILAIFLRLYAMVTAIQINWLFQVILLSILAYVAMTQRAKIFSVFTDALNFGGDKSIGFDGAGNKAGGLLKGAAGLAMGAAAGGAGAALGARVGGKGTKITAGLVKGQGLAAPVVGERSKKLVKAEKIAGKNAAVEASTAALTGGASAAGAGAKTVASVAAGKATITAKSATTALGGAGAAAGAGASVVGAGASMADRAQEAMSGHQKAVDHRQELRKVQGKSIRKGVMEGAINGMRGKGVASNFRAGVGHRKDEEKSTIQQLAAQGNTERSIAMNKLFALQLEQQEGAQADPVGAQRHAEMMGFDTVEEYNDSRRALGDREGETYENIDWDELSNVQRKATLNSPEAFQTSEEQQRLSGWQEKVAAAQSQVDEVKSGRTKVKSSEWVDRQQKLTFNQRKFDAANKEITERVVTRQAAAKNGDFSESDALKSQAARPKLDDFKKAEDAEFERRRAAGGSKPFPNGGK